jgi:hypothetical protein
VKSAKQAGKSFKIAIDTRTLLLSSPLKNTPEFSAIHSDFVAFSALSSQRDCCKGAFKMRNLGGKIGKNCY